MNMKKIFQEESIKILKILGLVTNIEEINQNELMSKKHKKVCRVFNYIEQLLISVSTVTGCVSIYAFASLVDIPTRITSSALD